MPPLLADNSPQSLQTNLRKTLDTTVLYMSYWAISTIFTVCPVQATPTSGCSQFVAVENSKIPGMPVFPGISGTWKVLNYYSHSPS